MKAAKVRTTIEILRVDFKIGNVRVIIDIFLAAEALMPTAIFANLSFVMKDTALTHYR